MMSSAQPVYALREGNWKTCEFENLVAIQPIADAPVPVDPRLLRLKQMVVDAVTAANSRTKS